MKNKKQALGAMLEKLTEYAQDIGNVYQINIEVRGESWVLIMDSEDARTVFSEPFGVLKPVPAGEWLAVWDTGEDMRHLRKSTGKINKQGNILVTHSNGTSTAWQNWEHLVKKENQDD